MATGSLNPYKRPYLDSCVYIAEVKGPTSDEAEQAAIAHRILTAAERGDFKVIASSIVIAEVVKARRGTGQTPPDVVRKINEVLSRDFVLWVEADVPLCTQAQDLQRKYPSLKPMDAVHVASAIRGEADYLLTWDPVILKAGIAELRVEKPTYQGQEEFDIAAATERPQLPAGQ